MELNKYDPLNTIHNESYDWHCRVRVQSFWKAMNTKTNEFWGYNMILIDDSNCRIHGYASAKYSEKIAKDIKEGGVYVVSNFKVKDYVGDETYRPVRHGKHIYFTERTQFEKCLTNDLQIENYAFDLFKLSDVQKFVTDNRFLIDVLGVMENFQPHYIGVKPTEEKPKVKFELSDGRCNVKVTLFDQFGIRFEDATKHLRDRKIYVILAACRVSQYDGSFNLTNYPATRVYINPNHYSVRVLQKRMEELEIQTQNIIPVEDPVPCMCVKDIKLLRGGQRQTKINCTVKVKKVDDKVCWYYARCTGCAKELQKQDHIYKCLDCNRLIPYPDKRFRLCTICSDNTGSIAVIFQNSEICTLIDCTVFDLETKAIEDNEEDQFPRILKQLQNKSYMVTIQLSNDNLLNGSAVYEACGIVAAKEVTADFEPGKGTSVVVDENVDEIMQESVLPVNQTETPTTGKSSTKTRARNVDYISFNATENLPDKHIKIEKDV